MLEVSPRLRAANTRSATSGPSGGIREGRVLSRSRPLTPSRMNRSCQRQTQVFDFPVRRMISFVPTPFALKSTIAVRQACFCGELPSLITVSRRSWVDVVTVMDIPASMRQTRTSAVPGESPSGLFC